MKSFNQMKSFNEFIKEKSFTPDDISSLIVEINKKSKLKKKKKWFHSCCKKSSGECSGCPEGMTLIRK
jgi:hypothetical protein